MKKNIIPYTLMLLIGFGLHNIAMSDIPSKIAVVDVNMVVSQSSEVMALKKDQKLKAEELKKWLTNVKADVDKQSTKEQKEKLIKKYESEYSKKQEVLRKDYTAKLQKIDKDISNIIAQNAKNKGYDVVLSKNVVLYGGDDLTATIAKLVK